MNSPQPLCELNTQMETPHLTSSYMYDNSFIQSNTQHPMTNGTLSQMSPYEAYVPMGHPTNGQRYANSYQPSLVTASQDKCWDENVPSSINDLSPIIYHRYNGNNPSNLEMCQEANMPLVGEQYQTNVYSIGYSCQSQVYHSFQAPLANNRSSGTVLNQAHTRSLYMPPTPPSSEPGSPSTQQQMQSRAGAVQASAHQLKQSSGPIHTTGSCLSSADSIQTPSKKQFSANGKQQQQTLAHFADSSQVSPITSSVHLSGTVSLPFGQQQQCGPSTREENQLSHQRQTLFPSSSTRLSTGLQHQQQQSQYNVSTLTQVTTTVQPRYNRRNNPELEKRRIHRCDYPG